MQVGGSPIAPVSQASRRFLAAVRSRSGSPSALSAWLLPRNGQTSPATSPDHARAVASIDMGIADLDGHLRSGDYLRRRAVPADELPQYRVIGDLTINNVTKPLSIDLELNGTAADPYGNERVGFEGSAEILRSEGGLTCNAVLEAGGVMVSDKVKLNFDISAIETVGGCQDQRDGRLPPAAGILDLAGAVVAFDALHSVKGQVRRPMR
ncbi:YceI family protein [Streptomyces sp. KR55]|uniref:YceI family protein n=1 Tax=Streptomyces sp. KR55 TaxID=3457425 RepID=UPI003FD58A5E